MGFVVYAYFDKLRQYIKKMRIYLYMSHFQQLINQNSLEFLADPRKVAFLDFLAIPKQERGLTQKEFAKKIQVSEQTLCEWKKLDGFQNELIKLVRSYTVSQTSEIISGLAKKAAGGDAAAAKLWFQFVLGWSEKTTHQVQSMPVPILSGLFLEETRNREIAMGVVVLPNKERI